MSKVDKILGAFTKTIAKLNVHAEELSTEIMNNEARQARLAEQWQTQADERERALRVARKLFDLVEGE